MSLLEKGVVSDAQRPMSMPDGTPIPVILAMVKPLPNPSSEEIFAYLKMFNYVVVSDEEFAAWLPATEFELSFSREGDIYANGKPLAVNVKQRYEALTLR